MKVYNISEAIIYLRENYGEQMPTSEETLRRAVRTKTLRVQEKGDPGKRGYTILEEDLQEYAKKRLKRIAERKVRAPLNTSGQPLESTEKRMEKNTEVLFPALYRKYVDGKLEPEEYYLALFSEKAKWEEKMRRQREQLMALEMEKQRLENDIEFSKSAIDAFENGIKKCKL